MQRKIKNCKTEGEDFCQNEGICKLDGSCYCKNGYTGSNCSQCMNQPV